MNQDLDDRPDWRVTRAGLTHVFGLHPAAVADLERRDVLVFDDDQHIDLAQAAAKIYAEARLLQIQALEKSAAIAALSVELTNRVNAMWQEMAADKPSRDALITAVADAIRAYQRIVDDMAAVIAVPMGSPERPRIEGGQPCSLN